GEDGERAPAGLPRLGVLAAPRPGEHLSRALDRHEAEPLLLGPRGDERRGLGALLLEEREALRREDVGERKWIDRGGRRPELPRDPEHRGGGALIGRLPADRGGAGGGAGGTEGGRTKRGDDKRGRPHAGRLPKRSRTYKGGVPGGLERAVTFLS